jgi:nucleotide-binding universal stress UspA family protein
MHIPGSAFAAFNTSQKKESEEIEGIFRKYTKNEDFVGEFRRVRAEAVLASDRMVESARAADLVIMAHEDKENDRYDQRHAQIQVIRESGRPVIVVPLGYDGPTIGANVLIGWSDTRESARAAHDMLPLADAGANLTVLRVGKTSRDALKDNDAIDVTEMFARHGLNATLEYREPLGQNIAEVLNMTAFEKGADLIVTGAFGHSRAYDFVLGATTYALLRDQKLPVLFSK